VQGRRRRRAGSHEREHRFLVLRLHSPLRVPGGIERAERGDVVRFRGRRGHAQVLRRRWHGERAPFRRPADAYRRRREAERCGGVPSLWLSGHGQPLGLDRQARTQVLKAAVFRQLRGLACRRLVNAGVCAEVDDVEELRVLVGALHLLGRRASLGVAVRAAVVAPANFATYIQIMFTTRLVYGL
jgi:hypothetical protein